MNDSLTVSLVIVSRQRPDALRRCLIAVSQLRYHPFEIVVVADPASCRALRAVPQAAFAKIVPFDAANISAARNIGISAAAGQVVAFLDDDAVPEPTWLTFLIAPFAQPEVMSAGGFVRGRNGISWQSKAGTVDFSGVVTPIDVDTDRPTVLTPTPTRAIKTEGTNMAVRRDCLIEMGGFDARFRFFLDETDLNVRLAKIGACTAIAPRAEVHHGFEASDRRRSDRVPTDLFEIGASWAVFLRKHCERAKWDQAWHRVISEQRRRLVAHMVSGRLEPRDVPMLMQGLAQGYLEGQSRVSEPVTKIPPAPDDFRHYPAVKTNSSRLITGRVWSRTALRRQARADVASRAVVTVVRLSPTALYHRVAFQDAGFWEQTGGLFGKSDRAQPLFKWWRFRDRVAAEVERVSVVRET